METEKEIKIIDSNINTAEGEIREILTILTHKLVLKKRYSYEISTTSSHWLWISELPFLHKFIRRIHRCPASISIDDDKIEVSFPNEYFPNDDSDDDYCKDMSFYKDSDRREDILEKFIQRFIKDLKVRSEVTLRTWIQQCSKYAKDKHFGIMSSSAFGREVHDVERYIERKLGYKKVTINVHEIVRGDCEDSSSCNMVVEI